MKQLITHLVDLTRHFDRKVIEARLIAALRDIASASEVMLYDIVLIKGQRWLRTKNIARDPLDTSLLQTTPAVALLDSNASLAECILRGDRLATDIQCDGAVVHWIPLWRGENVSSCISFKCTALLDTSGFENVQGILAVYENFLTLLDYSEKDSLTGLLNRKTFDQQFVDLVETVAVQTLPLEDDPLERRQSANIVEHWLAVIDIDHFKQVNDQYGHLYGDEVLIMLANILKQTFRDYDRVFRFGGEEFVVLLRSATRDNARRSFERLRERVASHKFAEIGQVTVSVGFVGMGANTPVTILGHADQALYFAKENGRNQVCFYDELVTAGKVSSVASNSEVDFF
jgi:diguanylate cyclase (GGDEF)-like protein